MSLGQTDLTDLATEPLLYEPDVVLGLLGLPAVHSDVPYTKFSWSNAVVYGT